MLIYKRNAVKKTDIQLQKRIYIGNPVPIYSLVGFKDDYGSLALTVTLRKQ